MGIQYLGNLVRFPPNQEKNWEEKLSLGKGKISLGVCGRFTLAELVSVLVSVGVVCIWVLTGHWALMDFLGMGLCVAFIAFVRLPSLKAS